MLFRKNLVEISFKHLASSLPSSPVHYCAADLEFLDATKATTSMRERASGLGVTVLALENYCKLSPLLFSFSIFFYEHPLELLC